MEAIIHKCHWCLDGLLMGEEQQQEAVHTHLGLTASGRFSIHVCEPSGVKPGYAWAESPPAAACEAC